MRGLDLTRLTLIVRRLDSIDSSAGPGGAAQGSDDAGANVGGRREGGGDPEAPGLSTDNKKRKGNPKDDGSDGGGEPAKKKPRKKTFGSADCKEEIAKCNELKGKGRRAKYELLGQLHRDLPSNAKAMTSKAYSWKRRVDEAFKTIERCVEKCFDGNVEDFYKAPDKNQGWGYKCRNCE